MKAIRVEIQDPKKKKEHKPKPVILKKEDVDKALIKKQ